MTHCLHIKLQSSPGRARGRNVTPTQVCIETVQDSVERRARLVSLANNLEISKDDAYADEELVDWGAGSLKSRPTNTDKNKG